MRKPKLTDEDYPTTGHEWDGIREYDKPMPRWWLITFIITVIWGIGYTIWFPAWPLINGATPGVAGYASRAEVAKEIEAVNAKNAAIESKLLSTPMESIATDPELARFASAGGAAVFSTFCSQCHGAGAQGFKGYPNLQDDVWLWGGDLNEIVTTVRHGIRHEQDEETRFSQMPVFGEILSEEEIAKVSEFVVSLSGQEHDSAAAAEGATIFADNCASCHGEDARGDREVGAPNLADPIWLFGGDRDTVIESVTYSRYGVMPAWQGRITDAQIKQVAFYVHQLGGGE